MDRESGETRKEIVYGEKALGFLYEDPIGRFLRQLFVTRPWFSLLNGWAKHRAFSRSKIPGFIVRYGVDAEEGEHSVEWYRTLDDFFIRRLRPGVRPIDGDPKSLVSPADGRVLVYSRLRGQTLRVKNSEVSLAALLGDVAEARRLEGGSGVVVRLAPADCHRFHFPVSGRVGPVRRLGRLLESVHPIALEAGAPSFRNRRSLCRIETASLGVVSMVEVGALTVGTIVQTHEPGMVNKGDEKGYFRFGGSTVLLFWEKGGPILDADLIENSGKGLETFVKMGTRIASVP